MTTPDATPTNPEEDTAGDVPPGIDVPSADPAYSTPPPEGNETAESD
jgi:hypothetical protein